MKLPRFGSGVWWDLTLTTLFIGGWGACFVVWSASLIQNEGLGFWNAAAFLLGTLLLVALLIYIIKTLSKKCPDCQSRKIHFDEWRDMIAATWLQDVSVVRCRSCGKTNIERSELYRFG